MAKLNFGCGKAIKRGWINVDIQKGKGIDKSFNFDKFPYPFESNTFDYVLLDNVLEHLDRPSEVLNELRRICKKDAIIKIIVPYYHSRGAYNDIAHKHFFNETTFDSFVNQEKYYGLKRKKLFRIKKMELVPTRLGKLIHPKKLRRLVSLLLWEVVSSIDVELIVLK